ncbi:MAG TPA: hypothetical protein DCS28_03800 [Candidatus Moranbacteria bacterium]|nr:hypothetical protein [Candidatus Moranbacteria bacterium]HAT75135.1 hypothetical protein [Candidatus Moranbacteria bacterium]
MLKQKLSSLKNHFSKNHFLAIFCLVLFFVFFYSHGASAAEESPGWFAKQFTGLVIFLLKIVLKFVTILLSGAETLFVYIVNPDNMKAIMDNNAIYTTWRTVRDVFNIAFIMVLLFSAFSTIFQYSKYGIKNIWLNLVLMALLVNFSYPIARFIIDVSNMLMYGFLNNLGGTGSFMDIIQKSGLQNMLVTTSSDPLYLLSAVVFTFIFAITLLVIAVLLVIRTITLAILIVFSPVAFTGSILPGTELASAASKWWTDFMKQCFAGPIIIFFLYIASKMLLAIGSSQDVIKTIAATQVPGGVEGVTAELAKLIAEVSYFSMPIIILWYGILQAQSSGIAGAQAVVGAGKKAGKWLAKNPLGGSAGFISKKSGLTGGVKARWANIQDKSWFGKKRQEEREAIIAGKLGVKGASENMKRKRIAAKQKEFEDERLSASGAELKMEKGDDVEKKAAALYLSKKDKINSSKTFDLAMKALAGDEELQKELRGKAKKDNNIKFVLDYDLTHGIEIEEKDEKTGEIIKKKITDRTKIYEKTLDMSSDDLAKQGSLHNSIEDDKELQGYIKSIGTKEKGSQYMTKLFEKLTPSQRAIYIKEGLNPESNATT